jgi:hypothetical protein
MSVKTIEPMAEDNLLGFLVAKKIFLVQTLLTMGLEPATGVTEPPEHTNSTTVADDEEM